MAESFRAKLESAYGHLSKGHRRIADFIKDNYERASFMTAAALGETVGVSESTVVRFAGALGFDGYPDLQRHLQEMVKSRLTSVQRMEVAARRYEGDDLIARAFTSDIEMIKATGESVSRSEFAASVAAINAANRVYILGVRSSAALASFAAFYLKYVKENVVLVDASAAGEMFEQMLRIARGDVCIAISFPRYSNQTAQAIAFAKDRGATVISITDGENSPIARYATHLLIAKSNMVSFVDSLTAPLSLISALIAACAEGESSQAHTNLETLEKIWDQYHVYSSDGEDA
ncbi:MAG: MurR/RpiR family transcriptional regulator [Clostridia bacterium]|nr:MurR/RpiR family transcriptional regulator [Clostridia bacterium]